MVIKNFVWFHQNAFYHRRFIDIIELFFSVNINNFGLISKVHFREHYLVDTIWFFIGISNICVCVCVCKNLYNILYINIIRF